MGWHHHMCLRGGECEKTCFHVFPGACGASGFPGMTERRVLVGLQAKRRYNLEPVNSKREITTNSNG